MPEPADVHLDDRTPEVAIALRDPWRTDDQNHARLRSSPIAGFSLCDGMVQRMRPDIRVSTPSFVAASMARPLLSLPGIMRLRVLLPAFLLVACEVQAIGFSSWELLDEAQRIRTSEDAEVVREEMIELVFGDAMPMQLPDDVTSIEDPTFHGRSIERVTIETDDLSSVVYLIHPSSWNGELAIYHQGHGGDFREHGIGTIDTLLEHNYQVLAFAMPMLGMNSHPFDTNQHFELSVREHPLRYFIEPVVVALNWAEEVYGYSRRIMVGLSGGGWTTVVVSGIDTRIDASYPVSGSWPHYLRDRFGSFGDYEERITPNYLELYLMATHPGRSQAQFFGELDGCCFGGLYAYDYLAYTSFRSNAWAGRFQILTDHDELGHLISEYTIGEILEMERALRQNANAPDTGS